MPLTTIKVLSKTGNLPRQAPANMQWGDFLFTFDANHKNYDWLVAYDDIHTARGSGKLAIEELACSPENTILVTHEPSAVKFHGTDFVNQFNHVLSCHEDWALKHHNRIHTHPLSPWWYGMHSEEKITYDALQATPPIAKTKTLSVICSDKQQTHTLHHKRYQFTKQLAADLPDLDWFGHGIQFIRDKSEAMNDFRYHIAIENHICPHYWTEKIADSFLAYCLPIYYGCPNILDYFPSESIIMIDIEDVEKSKNIIQTAIANNEYEKRLPAIIEARRLLMEKYNFFPEITNYISNLNVSTTTHSKLTKNKIYSRRQLLHQNPVAAIRYVVQKWKRRILFRSIYH